MSIRPSVGPLQHPALQKHLAQRAENVRPGDKIFGDSGLTPDGRRAIAHELLDLRREIEEGP